MPDMAVALLLSSLIAAVAYLYFRRATRYREVLPVLVTMTCCVAAFFAGAYVGGDKVHAELMALVPDEDLDVAAQFSGGSVPLLEVVVACALALVFFAALKFILEVVEANED